MLRIVDNFEREYAAREERGAVILGADSVPAGVAYLDFCFDAFTAREGEEGYFVIADAEGKGSRLCRFGERADGERTYRQNLMPICGVKRAQGAVLVIAEGCRLVFAVSLSVKGGVYTLTPRFLLDGNRPYEDLSLRVIDLGEEGDYSAMARVYRSYQLSRGACRPLRERAAEREALRYAVESPEIRIRMGWKPAPPTVLEQTAETEPPMHVACTFRDVRLLVEELERQGVDKAEICLVGWNKSGHDGRYPTLFPVEEALGGEAELRELVAFARSRGYQITCHTNSTDAYSISRDFSEDIVAKEKSGALSVNPYAWSGGRMYNLCPVKSREFAERDLPRVGDLGFRGLHYIDVMTVVPPRRCYDGNHPVTEGDTVKLYGEIMELATEIFGGFASEGVFDFAAPWLDYGLYRSWPRVEDPSLDEEVPLWELVYHGIILSNPNTDTVNYPVKPKRNGLFVIECGGRPSFYFYSKFLEGSGMDDWLGREDLFLGTDEQRKFAVEKILEAYKVYKSLLPLQYEFIKEHKEVSPGVFEVTYSSGTVIRVDYNLETFSVLPSPAAE